MPLLEISVVPVGTASASFSSQVTAAVQRVAKRGLSYQVTPIATVVEGSMDDLWTVAREIHETAFADGADRVITNISIDDRKDKRLSLDGQVQAVEQSLQ